jgi:hypothetical protein
MSRRTFQVSPSTHLGVAMGGHTSGPKYENSCVLSNAGGKCRMGVTAMDLVDEQRGAGTGYGATGRLPGVQRTLTKVSNCRHFPAMSPLSRHVAAFPPFPSWPAGLPPPGGRRRWENGYPQWATLGVLMVDNGQWDTRMVYRD